MDTVKYLLPFRRVLRTALFSGLAGWGTDSLMECSISMLKLYELLKSPRAVEKLTESRLIKMENRQAAPSGEARRDAPDNMGRMNDPDGSAFIKGQCGDTMEMYLVIADGVITEAVFFHGRLRFVHCLRVDGGQACQGKNHQGCPADIARRSARYVGRPAEG